MPHTIPFPALPTADLIVEAVYEGGTAGHTGDDPLSRLLHVGNQGGVWSIFVLRKTPDWLLPFDWHHNSCLDTNLIQQVQKPTAIYHLDRLVLGKIICIWAIATG